MHVVRALAETCALFFSFPQLSILILTLGARREEEEEEEGLETPPAAGAAAAGAAALIASLFVAPPSERARNLLEHLRYRRPEPCGGYARSLDFFFKRAIRDPHLLRSGTGGPL